MELPNVVKPWLDALESGDYKQGKYALVDTEDEYCCLGVFAKLNNVHMETFNKGTAETTSDCFLNADSYDIIMAMIPRGFIFFDKVISMNDNGESFNQIAQYIRDFYEGAE